MPALGSSLHKTVIGAIPPVKFKSIEASFASLQDIGLTIGAIKNMGCSIVMVTFASHRF